MKGLFRVITLALLLAGFVSCSSINKELIRSVKNVAVISIVFDKNVDVSDVSSDAGVLGLISSLAQNDKFRLDTEVESFKKTLFADYADYFPFKLAAENTIISQKEYQQLVKATLGRNNNLVTPAKYAKLDLSQGNDINSGLQAAPTADGIMIVRVHYALQKTLVGVMGVGTANVNAYVTLIVLNKSGREVLVLNQWAASDNTLSYAFGGVFKGDDVIPLVKEATKNVMKSMADWLKKNPL